MHGIGNFARRCWVDCRAVDEKPLRVRWSKGGLEDIVENVFDMRRLREDGNSDFLAMMSTSKNT